MSSEAAVLDALTIGNSAPGLTRVDSLVGQGYTCPHGTSFRQEGLVIKNEHQYKMTRNLAQELEESLAELVANEEYNALPKQAQKAHSSSLKRQLAQYQAELREYEALKSGQFDFDKLPEIAKIPKWLIQARIARGLDQEGLAKLLNLKKQQVQQYEATEYAAASLARLQQVAEVLLR
jgi:hypothetical protein